MRRALRYVFAASVAYGELTAYEKNINPEAVGISRNSSLARLISAACGNDAFTGLESVDAIAEEFHQQMASKTEAQLSYLAMRLMEQSSRDPALASKFTAFTKVLRRSFQRQPVHSNRFFNGLRKWSTRTSEQKSELQDLLASIDPQNPEAFLTQPDSQVVTMWGTSTSNSSSAVARTVDFMRQLDTSSLRTKVLQIVIAIIWYEACENVKPGTGEQDSHWRECDWEALYSSCVFAADISLTVFKNTIKPYKLYGHRLNILLKELGWDSLIQFIPFLDLKMAVRGWTIDEEAEAFYDWARDHEVGKDTNSSNIVKPLVDALKKNLPLKAEMQTAIQCSHSTMSRIDRNSKDDESKKPGRKKRKQTVVAIVDDDGYSFPMRRSEY